MGLIQRELWYIAFAAADGEVPPLSAFGCADKLNHLNGDGQEEYSGYAPSWPRHKKHR